MAFPRQFKSETWFMRVPTGEVEVVTAEALEDAFRCGLADARTPVRSVGSKVWTTLAEVAGIDTSSPEELGSLLPVALEEQALSAESGEAWQMRREIDTRGFRPSARRVVASVVAVAGVLAGTVAGGVRLWNLGYLAKEPHLAAQVVAVEEVPRPTPERIEPLRPVKEDSDEQEYARRRALDRKLDEMDLIRRMTEAASPRRTERLRQMRSRTPIEPPRPAPFSDSGNPLDPLNGGL
jgi:hypothetical protein